MQEFTELSVPQNALPHLAQSD